MQFLLERRKRQDEKIRTGIDFVEDLNGDTIGNHSVKVLDDADRDLSSTMLLSSNIVGTAVIATIGGGVNNVKYRAFFHCISALGLEFTHSVLIEVGPNT